MNGWLSAEGNFIQCEHMEHDKIAEEQFGLSEQGMWQHGYVKIFSCFGMTDVIPCHFLSDKQIKWLEQHDINI